MAEGRRFEEEKVVQKILEAAYGNPAWK